MSDVLVIGGGVIGCGIARALTARGASVTLVDPRPVGEGASRASAGMLAPFTEGRHDRALQVLGERSLSSYDALIQTLAEGGGTVGYSKAGSLDVAFDASGAATLDEVAASLAGDHVDCHRLDRVMLRELEPAVSSRAIGGLTIPAHGAVDVPALVKALWASAVRAGAALVRTRAHRISRSGSGVRVDTSDGMFEAAHVVLAAGCWAGQVDIEGVPPLPVQPVRGQLVALRSELPPPARTLWGPGCYLVPWPDGTVLVGATVEHVGFDERATASGVGQLLREATALVPGLSEAAFVEARVGLRPGTFDDRPLVGASQRAEGVIYATGHYRNGALLMPITAEAVADLVEGTPLDQIWAPCNPARFGSY